LRHSFTVAAPPADVVAHLREPANYVGLSPLVVAVRNIARSDGVVRYTAVERFQFGPLRYDNAIQVTLRVADGVVSGDVSSPGGVTMSYRYAVTGPGGGPGPGGGSAVSDTLVLHAPFGLRRFAASRARAVQLARARILAARLA
jgi:hypothetical protein